MADVFISYAREDAAAVEKLAAALESNGHDVWWDRHLTPGARYLEETEQALKSAGAVLVVWTQTSIKSHWVADEAGVGRDRNALVPISLDGSMPPLGFRQFQVMDFSGWHGAANDPRVRDLTAALAKLSPAPGQAAPAKSARPPRPKWFVPAIAAMAVAVLALGAGSLWLMVRNGDAAWLDKEALPQMEALIDSGDWEGAYALAQRAEQRLPESRAIEEFWPRLSWKTTITSEPSGAKVFRRAYNAPADAAWEELGVTPLENIRIPFGYSRLRFELAGYQTLNRAIGGGIRTSQELRPDTLMAHVFAVGAGNFKLDPLDGLYPDKVRVPGGDMLINGQLVKFADYFIDRTEVTNAKFKEFVDAGGYANQELWEPITLRGKSAPWAEAMKTFVDSTGRPGPSTWIGGDYPKGRDDYPVTGVSWYEAMAYAKFRRQDLPTAYHWDFAQAPSELPWLLPVSNFNSEGPRKVGEGNAMSYSGALDMLGNAREWTASASGNQRAIRGGGWTDPQHCVLCLAPPDNREATNGFRLAVIRDDPATAAIARAPVPPQRLPAWPDPVSDMEFKAYSALFNYDVQRPLDAVIEKTTTSRAWKTERITFDAGYGSERVILYLFLPAKGAPPYQTVLFWPDAAASGMTSMDQYSSELDFVLASGRAVALPVMFGTFERGGGNLNNVMANFDALREKIVNMTKDTRRTVDYLLTRNDIDGKAIALYGFSWGATFVAPAIAQEKRFKTAILNTGGLPRLPGFPPEIDPSHAVTRINIPVLMLNGKYDSFMLPENAQRFYDMLPEREPRKKRVIADSGHYVPRDVLVRETLDWLDKHLGPAPVN
jgi:dienelactone hydrolase